MGEFFHVIGDYLADSWDMIMGRSGGPFKLRFILQPVVATTLAIRAGLRDARAGRSPYLWRIASSREKYERHTLFKEGWGDIGKVFTIAIVLDVIYEIVVFRWVYPVQALIMATVLALVPYLIFRGLTTRIAGRKRQSATH
jgi:hypothetical protein